MVSLDGDKLAFSRIEEGLSPVAMAAEHNTNLVAIVTPGPPPKISDKMATYARRP